MKVNLTLTDEQANLLVCYIIQTTTHREECRKAWESIAQERNEDGTPKFKNAESNARYYADLEWKLNEIKRIIDNAPYTE